MDRFSVVQRFQERTGRGPDTFNECKGILDAHRWDLEAAVAADFTRRGGGGAAGSHSCWGWLVAWLVRAWRPWGSFLGSMAPRTLALSPVDAARQFTLSFEAEYGLVHPTFAQCSLPDAVKQAKREIRFLLIYLHSPLHGDTPAFCRQTLTAEATTEFINTNFVLWAADVTSRSGYEAAGALRVTSYPYMCVMYASGEDLRVYDQIIGPLGVDELLGRLMVVLEEHGAVLVAERAELQERSRNRVLLQQQDDDYAQSLAQDVARSNSTPAVAPKPQQQQQQQQPAPKKAGSSSSASTSTPKKPSQSTPATLNNNNNNNNSSSSSAGGTIVNRNIASAAVARPALVLPPEPAADEQNVAQVALRLPHTRVERRFRLQDPLSAVFQYVDSVLASTDSAGKPYLLVTAYPRVVYKRTSTQTLAEAGFLAKTALIYEQEDDE